MYCMCQGKENKSAQEAPQHGFEAAESEEVLAGVRLKSLATSTVCDSRTGSSRMASIRFAQVL